MKEEELKRCLEFLEYFGVKKDKENIYVNDGYTSIICNPNTEWKDFLGHSILEVAEAVGKELQLKIKWT
ncbi:MAG: hypothetical protein WC346_21910 [Methanogenium sp.]